MTPTDLTDRQAPDDPEAEFLAELDAAVSGWPVHDGSHLLATATRVRHLAASDPRVQLDPARRQEIWERIMAGQRASQVTHESTGRVAKSTRLRVPQPSTPTTSRHSWRPGGWLATAVAICIVALLSVPLVRELGSDGHATAPSQIPAQTRSAALGSGGNVTTAPTSVSNANAVANSSGDNATGATKTPNVTAPTQGATTGESMLAPPSTVIATMSPNLTVGERVKVADPHQLLAQLEQIGFNYGWEDRYRTDPSGKRKYSAIPWTMGDSDLRGAWGGVEIVQEGQADQPLAGYIVFGQPEQAAQRLQEITRTPGLVTTPTRVDQYDGVILLNNDRVTTIVQVGNVLVVGNAWTPANDWVSTEDDLQAFKWQSLKETISAIAYLDHVVTAYQGHR